MPLTCKIEITTGPNIGETFELHPDEAFIIGRGSDSHTRIQDPTISRIHCRIDWEEGEPILVDVDSSSGTFVNGKKINRQRLLHEDVIALGVSKMVFLRSGKSRREVLEENPWLANNPLFQAVKPADSVDDLVGQTIANYRVGGLISRGSSSVVYKAWDHENNRSVALKILSRDQDSPDEQKDRFVRAIKTTLDLKHPHIVQLYAAGKTGPHLWCAMEYVQGDSLSKLIEWIGVGNSLDWKEVFIVAAQIGRALQEAEKRKIIHRNVTPNNILRRSKDCCHLLGDLMLAKALEGTHSREITKPGQIVGELPYLPPERTYPNAVVDERSDLYGLGATLYGLITGKAPGTGRNPIEIIQNIRSKDPMKPSLFQKNINKDFEETVMRLIAKSPDDRFPSSTSLLIDLRRIAEKHKLDMDWAAWIG
jgi:eukaryotic-like serine/threonine-protein kinase